MPGYFRQSDEVYGPLVRMMVFLSVLLDYTENYQIDSYQNI